MFKIIKRVGRQWWIFPILFLFIAGNVFCDFLLPVQLGNIIKVLQSAKDLEDPAIAVLAECVYMLLIAGVSAVCAIITCKLSSVVSARIISVTRYELFKRAGTFSFSEMNKFSVSSLVTRTTNDLTFVGNTLNMLFRYILYGPLLAIVAIIGLIVLGKPDMMLAILGALILIIIVILIVVKIVLPRYEAIQTKLDKVALVTRENLDGLRVVRAYNAEDFQEKKFAGINEDLMKTERFSNRGLGVLVPVISIIVGLLNVIIYSVGAKLVENSDGTFVFADISVVIQFAALILMGFIMMVSVIIQLPRTLVCAKRINEVIDTEPAVQSAEKSPVTSKKGTIEFRNVTFSYPGAELPALENLNFRVEQGQTLAIIGATGAG
ncbi:MAG: hypothetical protein HUJ76_11935, partial [Parasporobacterium sp.]|nr:hypothetical protein [Parasporobacterium sp.]